jgi:hypothetical protein
MLSSQPPLQKPLRQRWVPNQSASITLILRRRD